MRRDDDVHDPLNHIEPDTFQGPADFGQVIGDALDRARPVADRWCRRGPPLPVLARIDQLIWAPIILLDHGNSTANSADRRITESIPGANQVVDRRSAAAPARYLYRKMLPSGKGNRAADRR
jgi:hypothetical protein